MEKYTICIDHEYGSGGLGIDEYVELIANSLKFVKRLKGAGLHE